MSFLAARLTKQIRASARATFTLFSEVQRSSKLWNSKLSFDGDNNGGKSIEAEDFRDDIIPEKRGAIPQGVDPRRGWNFRGVHKAVLCGKVGQNPIQKLLRNGKTLTIFIVGTGGMWDHRIMGAKDLPKPVQWHRVVVHHEPLGAYAVQQLVKNSSVYLEGDIEIRVYNRGYS